MRDKASYGSLPARSEFVGKMIVHYASDECVTPNGLERGVNITTMYTYIGRGVGSQKTK